MARKNINHKRYRFLIIVITLLIAFGLFYSWGAYHYRQEKQIDRIVASLRNPQKNMTAYVTPTNPDTVVTKASLTPLQSYFKKNPRAARELAYNLRHGKDTEQIKLVENGNYFLLFPKYVLQIQVYRPQVESNHPDSTLNVDGKDLGKMAGADQNFYQDLGLVFPGRYHFVVKTDVSGRKLQANAVVNIWSSKTINLKIKTGTFQIRSVPKGVVYINDRKVKVLNDQGQAVFKNYPLAKATELYIQSSYHGKKIRSLTVKDLATAINSEFDKSDDNVSDYGNTTGYDGNQKQDVYQDVEGDYIVNPIWPGLVTKIEAQELITNMYTKPAVDLFEKGKDSTALIEVKKEIKQLKKYTKKAKIIVEVTKILPAGKDHSEVNYQLVDKSKDKKKTKDKVIYKNTVFFHMVNNVQLVQKLVVNK